MKFTEISDKEVSTKTVRRSLHELREAFAVEPLQQKIGERCFGMITIFKSERRHTIIENIVPWWLWHNDLRDAFLEGFKSIDKSG